MQTVFSKPLIRLLFTVSGKGHQACTTPSVRRGSVCLVWSVNETVLIFIFTERIAIGYHSSEIRSWSSRSFVFLSPPITYESPVWVWYKFILLKSLRPSQSSYFLNTGWTDTHSVRHWFMFLSQTPQTSPASCIKWIRNSKLLTHMSNAQ